MQLTKSQIEATETLEENLQIIACAGSGKTQVVAQRIVNILLSGKAEPKNIVAFTFTEKAAAELKHRVLYLYKQAKGNVHGLAEMYVGTIHSWCFSFLQGNIPGYQKFGILDEIKLKLFVDKHYKTIGMKPLGMQRFKETNYFIQLVNIVREGKAKTTFPDKIIEAVESFERTLEANNYFDFTMILTKFYKELCTDGSRLQQKIKSELRFLIVDEYQDVNDLQESIIRHLNSMGANLCVVGDDDQTIYQWRGSSVQNILQFADNYDNVKTIKLEENFRSSKAVIDVASRVISNIPGSERLEKKMVASGHQIYEEGDARLNEFETIEEERNFLVNMINKIRGIEFVDAPGIPARGLDYSDICILVRQWSAADRYAGALREAGIPFVITGLGRLFEQDEVKACRGIFLFIDQNIDGGELKNLWINAAPNIDQSKLEGAIAWLQEIDPSRISWYELFNLQEIFKLFREKAEITEEIFGGRGEVAFYNMGKFSQVIEDFETIHFKDSPIYKLSNFLNFIKYTAEGHYPEGDMQQGHSGANAVTIMSVHQAKGLEFPVVFIPGMNRNYFPSKKPGGRSVWHFLDSGLIENQERYLTNQADETRLFYVALTRSKKFLFVSRAPLQENRLYRKESIFCEYLRESKFIYHSTIGFPHRKHTTPTPKKEIDNILLNFSLLEDYFGCPYAFKYYKLYGFKEPISGRIGYGKSIHDALMEIHLRAMEGNLPPMEELDDVFQRHKNFPYAIEKTEKEMSEKAKAVIQEYYLKNKSDFSGIEYVEKPIELDLGRGILVSGRIDLIIKKDLDGNPKVHIVDFKSKTEGRDFPLLWKQLLLYSVGYQELVGKKPDRVEIYDFDKPASSHVREVENKDLESIKEEIRGAAENIRQNNLEHKCSKKGCICKFAP